jgi:hypothetical protein
MSDVIRRLADDDPNDADDWAGSATVTSAAAGNTPDGRLLIGVRIGGTNHTCTYLASYTPVVGHVVAYLKRGSSVLVLGKPATL